MDQSILLTIVILLASICDGQWQSSEDRQPAKAPRRGVHSHTRRHVLRVNEPKESPEARKQIRQTSPIKKNMLNQRSRVNYKPAGHLAPLNEDDIDNDEVMSVAIGPPPMRPIYEKLGWKQRIRNYSGSPNAHYTTTKSPAPTSQGAVALIKDVLSQVAQEFLTRQVNEDFVFGQYVGHALRNISKQYKLKFQHEILDLMIKYQNMSRRTPLSIDSIMNIEMKNETSTIPTKLYLEKVANNDTDDNIMWDFNNLANIVG